MHLYEKFYREVPESDGSPARVCLEYPPDFNFGYDVVDAMAAAAPQQRAIVWCNEQGEERTFTFAQLKDLSDRAAAVFQKAGLRRGDRVMVILKRHYEYWITAVALHKLGAVMIPATHMLTIDDLIYRFRAAQPKAVVCTPQDGVPERICRALKEARRTCMLWSVQESVPGFANLTEDIARTEGIRQRIPTSAEDPMLLYFTSGTTGEPKGVVHDFTYPLAHIVTAKYWQQAEDGGLHFTVAETGWAKASWGKIYGQWLVGSAVMVFD
ncbi:MAG: AMP-binding protein, partial [Butyricicoccaceae bacterium]